MKTNALLLFALLCLTACTAPPTSAPTLTTSPSPSATLEPWPLTLQANQTQNAIYEATQGAGIATAKSIQATNLAKTPSPTPFVPNTPTSPRTPSIFLYSGYSDSETLTHRLDWYQNHAKSYFSIVEYSDRAIPSITIIGVLIGYRLDNDGLILNYLTIGNKVLTIDVEGVNIGEQSIFLVRNITEEQAKDLSERLTFALNAPFESIVITIGIGIFKDNLAVEQWIEWWGNTAWRALADFPDALNPVNYSTKDLINNITSGLVPIPDHLETLAELSPVEFIGIDAGRINVLISIWQP